MLDLPRLVAAMQAAGSTWETPVYSRVTSSTQDDARHLRTIGKRLPFAVITDEQTAGRGRLARTWTAPAGSAVLLTIALPTPTDVAGLPLAIGVTVLRVLQQLTPELRLKWPNDIVMTTATGFRKLGGLIVELDGDAALIGIGINTAMRDDELPTEHAISFAQLGVAVDRETVVAALVSAFESWSRPTMSEYRAVCSTLGNDVAVLLADGNTLQGRAVNIADDGGLLVDVGGELCVVATGDVQQVRGT